MRMKLTREKEHLVLENQKLVYYIVRKMGKTPTSTEYEDLVSIGTIGLVKAAIQFDQSKGIKFSSYAYTCIKNEILIHFKKANNYANDISIDEPIQDDGENKTLTVGDLIEHPESNFVEKIINEEAFMELIRIVLNCLKNRDRIIMLYRIGGISQIDIAKILQISNRYVSAIESRAISKIRKVTNHPIDYKEVFSMEIIGDKYIISFSPKDITNLNKIFVRHLQNLTTTENSPDFKVNCNRERIVVQIPAHPESFSFIAQIIQKIDYWCMTFVSDADNTT